MTILRPEQVVVSNDWNIIGFQPTNRVAVNNWASNPLSKELYGGKKLSPGMLQKLSIRFHDFLLVYLNSITLLQVC